MSGPEGWDIIIAIENDAKEAWDDFCESDLKEKSKVVGNVGTEVVLVTVPASKVTSAVKASRLGKAMKGINAFGRFKKGTLYSFITSKFDDVLKGAGKTNIGKKLDYVFGKATGSTHNIQRSKSMENELKRIGIHDTPANRTLLKNHLDDVFGNPKTYLAHR